MAAEPRPEFLHGRDDRWAVADRVAWGELDVAVGRASAPLLARLRDVAAPVHLASQLIHGDVCGNVLLAPGLDPAIIDVSPYWRPAAYADAVVAVDALLWWGADASLLDDVGGASGWDQLLVRAAIFRLVALDERARQDDADVRAQLAGFDRVVAVIEHRCGR